MRRIAALLVALLVGCATVPALPRGPLEEVVPCTPAHPCQVRTEGIWVPLATAAHLAQQQHCCIECTAELAARKEGRADWVTVLLVGAVSFSLLSTAAAVYVSK